MNLVFAFTMATTLAAAARTGSSGLSTACGDVDRIVRAAGPLAGVDADGANTGLLDRPDQVDRQKPVVETRARHFDAIGKHEGALELAGRGGARKGTTGRAR